ncbi:hypothetical protein BC826DRAFT_924056 [Russula brevipes]|nr:hypothetical protein BC826DRAFT_924056 [Russula brevipes]
MAAVNSARECPICLDKFRDPVVTPCGHVSCSACMKTHARGSSDPYEATCPTCRAPFPIVTPDMSIVPKKYHVFISPPLRRVFLGDSPVAEDSGAIEEGLRAEIAVLDARVASLRRDKDLLMDRCEAAQSAVARLTTDERAARLARDKAREDVYLANVKFEKLRVECDALKSR